MNDERESWRRRAPDEQLARRLRVAVWVVSGIVLLLVGMMQRIRIPLPEGWSTGFLPPFHAGVNVLVALALVAAVVLIRRGRVLWHRRAMMTALVLSVVFLLSYVAYHLTNEPQRYGGEGWLRGVYFALLISHILLAAVSLPFILLSFVAAWTSDFARHRRLARRVFPVWLYVAVSGPLVYLMLKW